MADLHSEVPRRLMARIRETRIEAICILDLTDHTHARPTEMTETEVGMDTATATIQTPITGRRRTEDIRLAQEEDLQMTGVAGPEIITVR